MNGSELQEAAQWAPAIETDLPREVQALLAYRRAESEEQQVEIVADLSVRWDLLSDSAKGPLVWKAIARQMGPQALRMNLDTLLRHEVFSNTKRTVGKAIAEAIGIGRSKDEMVDYVAERLADPETMARCSSTCSVQIWSVIKQSCHRGRRAGMP